MFTIRMGVPEMKDLWKALAKKNRQGKLSKSEAALYRKWGKALKFLSQNPRHPGLASHEIDALSLAVWGEGLAVLPGEQHPWGRDGCFGCMALGKLKSP